MRDDPFENVIVGSLSKPTFYDIDNDGDQDLVVGNDLGALVFYRNAGSVSSPYFLKIADSENPLLAVGGRTFAAPAFGVIDGVTNLVVGSATGKLTVYRDAPSSRPSSTRRTKKNRSM